jgi:hypothetical protein
MAQFLKAFTLYVIICIMILLISLCIWGLVVGTILFLIGAEDPLRQLL